MYTHTRTHTHAHTHTLPKLLQKNYILLYLTKNVWIFKMSFIPVIKATFSASLHPVFNDPSEIIFPLNNFCLTWSFCLFVCKSCKKILLAFFMFYKKVLFSFPRFLSVLLYFSEQLKKKNLHQLFIYLVLISFVSLFIFLNDTCNNIY